MKPDFIKLIREHNGHNMILNPDGLVNALDFCYNQGIKDGREEVYKLLSNMNHLTDNINYIIEELKNQKK